MIVAAPDARAIATSWLSAFSEALSEKDIQAVTSLFLPNGWLRDVLVFGWDSHSLEGTIKISNYLKAVLPNAQLKNIALDERPFLVPRLFRATPDVSGIELAFTCETDLAVVRGMARLLPDAFEDSIWRALSVYIAIEDIKGHEEADHELGLYGGHTLVWGDVKDERRAEVERDPEVVIIGAAQTGLQVAARFKQMGLRSLVIERNPRIGDNWRKRYPTLTLHTPRTHHALLYAPFPTNWPTFTPRDKVASWLEQYSEAQDLVVWTSSFPVPGPTYDSSTGRWTLMINKDGSEVTLRPAHIVLATGTLGDPLIPTIPSSSLFRGTTLHASSFQGGKSYEGKRVLVVGAGNTSADVCQDLVFRNAAAVTMLQRSETCVVSAALVKEGFDVRWPEGVPIDVCDFRAAAMPLGLLKKLMIGRGDEMKAYDKDMHKGLEEKGLKLTFGPEGEGQILLVFERLGGYWIDVGLAELIIEDKMKVKSGVEITEYIETGVKFSDGSELEVDTVIFATGYKNIRETMKKIFGNEIIDRTHEVWGLDEEGELRGCYRQSGQPGLWFAAGDFFHSRFMSKQLVSPPGYWNEAGAPNPYRKAILIKAELLGLTARPNLATAS